MSFPTSPASIVGYVLLCTPELPTIDVLPTDIELKRIYLFSRFRSAPVLDAAGAPIPNLRPAQALMDAAVADARALGASRLLLGTHETTSAPSPFTTATASSRRARESSKSATSSAAT